MALAVLAAYRTFLSPLMGGTCRFTPTCSVYAEEAVRVHGVLRGGWLALKRLARCQPLGGWGHDPVPPAVLDESNSPAPSHDQQPDSPLQHRAGP
jgi:putative membrane protein insertion efficiency factor